MYLFKSGNFYIFLDEDAKNISKIVPLKLTKFSNDILKCGFPLNSYDRYMDVFKNLKLNIDIVDESNIDNNKIIDKIRSVNLDTLKPIDAIKVLEQLKEMVK